MIIQTIHKCSYASILPKIKSSSGFYKGKYKKWHDAYIKIFGYYIIINIYYERKDKKET